MPNLLILNSGPDTAGCGIGLKRAFDKYAPDWTARAVCRGNTYIDYPTDIVWPIGAPSKVRREVVTLARKADVIHVMDAESALAPFRGLVRRKKVVVHHLGTHFRRDPIRISANCQAYGATEVTDSIDLLLFPHITWLPVPADLDGLAELRKGYRPSKRIKIAHAPTNRPVKSTEAIVVAIEELSKSYPIDFDLIEGVSNHECLERKAQADIFVDQLTIGFGLNAIECWAMGIPVVSGLTDPDARKKAIALFGHLPWADATQSTLPSVIEHLIVDKVWRATLGDRGQQHVQRFHSQQAVVERTLEVYAGR